jgi:hypothetical protein
MSQGPSRVGHPCSLDLNWTSLNGSPLISRMVRSGGQVVAAGRGKVRCHAMADSSHLLKEALCTGCWRALQQRLALDGYLQLRGVLPAADVMEACACPLPPCECAVVCAYSLHYLVARHWLHKATAFCKVMTGTRALHIASQSLLCVQARARLLAELHSWQPHVFASEGAADVPPGTAGIGLLSRQDLARHAAVLKVLEAPALYRLAAGLLQVCFSCSPSWRPLLHDRTRATSAYTLTCVHALTLAAEKPASS